MQQLQSTVLLTIAGCATSPRSLARFSYETRRSSSTTTNTTIGSTAANLGVPRRQCASFQGLGQVCHTSSFTPNFSYEISNLLRASIADEAPCPSVFARAKTDTILKL